jgi:cellulose 1,4-beta-cellobiosidase
MIIVSSASDGLNKYKTQFIDGFAKRVGPQKQGISFAIVLEPDSLGNAVTNLGVPFCATATPIYEDGIAYAISKLQYPHVALYMDAAHGGWLGWDDGLPQAAAEFGKVVKLANSKYKKGSKIRGFSTDISNYVSYIAPSQAFSTRSDL